MFRRREVLALGGAAAVGVVAGASRPDLLREWPPHFRGEALFADVHAYASAGAHRTGGTADRSTARWLAAHLAATGFDVRPHPFRYRRFDLEETSVTVAGRALEAHPQWPVTRPVLDVGGTLGVGGRGALALVDLPYNEWARIDLPAYWSALERARDGGAVAAIAATPGPTGGLIVMNPPRDGRALPLPVVLASGRDTAFLREAAERGRDAAVRVRGRSGVGIAHNVVGTRGTHGALLVVSTPMSAWTPAAGERGVGVALWRAVASAARSFGDRRVMMVATSGHELGHVGADALLPSLRPLIDAHGLDCWFHLGANVATRGWTTEEGVLRRETGAHRGRWLMASTELLPSLAWCFVGEPGLTPAPLLPGLPAGELATLSDAGFRPLAGIFGAGLLHHVMGDLPYAATSPELLEAVARPLWRFLLDRTR